MTGGLVFGQHELCRRCEGRRTEHHYHMDKVGDPPRLKSRPCEHPCPRCLGSGVVRVGTYAHV